MAITTNTCIVVAIPNNGEEFRISQYSADITGAEEILAGVAGYAHYLRKLMIRCATTTTITIGSGENASAVATIHLGPIPLNAASGIFNISFGCEGLKFTDGASIVIDSADAAPIMIYAEGRTCKKIL